eukprot:5268962-Prymnesium_polylepis.1
MDDSEEDAVRVLVGIEAAARRGDAAAAHLKTMMANKEISEQDDLIAAGCILDDLEASTLPPAAAATQPTHMRGSAARSSSARRDTGSAATTQAPTAPAL